MSGTSTPVTELITEAKTRRAGANVEFTIPGTAHHMAHAPSPEERAGNGKALRDRVPRQEHGTWQGAENRPDPVELLQAGDADRVPELVPIRYGRMLASPFAFFRGSAALMAADLAGTPQTGLRVQACGDCHLGNFGGFATPERNILFDLNDFDETLPAPWEWDVKRLAASCVLAARSNGLSDRKGQEAAVECTRSYRKRLAEYSQMHPLEVWYSRITAEDLLAPLPKPFREQMRRRIAKAANNDGSEAKLASMVNGRLGIRDAPPLIYHPETSRRPDFQTILEQVFAAYRETLADDRRVLLDHYRVVDAAIKVVGVGSVGRECWVALLMSEGNDPLFLQVKQAVESVLEPYAGKSAYTHHGERVVMGQRLMQPASDLFLGWVTAKATGTEFYVRQLRDVKIKPMVETFDAELLLLYAKACGWVLARAHAKTADTMTITGYLGQSTRFEDAIGDFALAYADQTERDHAALKRAVRNGKVTAHEAA
jgi:uncharacterized protein (DUF2252 family)